MNFVDYLIETRNYSALSAVNEYTKVFGHTNPGIVDKDIRRDLASKLNELRKSDEVECVNDDYSITRPKGYTSALSDAVNKQGERDYKSSGRLRALKNVFNQFRWINADQKNEAFRKNFM